MTNFVNQHDFNELLIWKTTIIMPRKTEQNMAYGDEASWHFIETVFTGENKWKACILISKLKLPLLLDLVQNAYKLDLKDPGNSFCCSATPC